MLEALYKSEKRKYIEVNGILAIGEMEKNLFEILKDKYYYYDEIIFLCIGTDRSTGDCLGPLVGYKLEKIVLKENVYVYGTIEEPIHAKNLEEKIKEINDRFDKPLIIAIDASLGSPKRLNNIIIERGGIKPGSGVNKDLPEVGEISITGIVNIYGFMEFAILQNTRLSTVVKMADVIVGGIILCLRRI